MTPDVADELRSLAGAAGLVSDALIGVDLDDRITFWSHAAERVFGWTAADAVGRNISIVVPPAQEAQHAEWRRCARAGELVRHFDTVCRRADDSHIAVSWSVGPLWDGAGQLRGLVVAAGDLSGRDRGDRAARRLAAIIESSDDAIASKDLNGIVTSWNAAAERMFGYSAAEMIGASIRLVIPPDRQGEEDDTLAKIRRGEKVEHYETIRRRKDGTFFPIALTVSPIRDEEGRVVGASKIARDISALKEAQHERLRLAHENASITERINQVGTVVASALDRERIVQAVTDAATELTSARFGVFFDNVANDGGEPHTRFTLSGITRETFDSVLIGRGTELFDSRFGRSGVVRSDDLTTDPRYAHDRPFAGMPAGQVPVRSYLAVPVQTGSGDVLGGLFFGHPDAGRFSEAHERLAVGIASWAAVALENARLYVSVKEASRLKDEFLASLSHELRTPLNAILGYARMLRSGIIGPERQLRAIETVERNATSLTQIVEDVLDVSRIISGKMRLNVQPVDLPDVVRSSIDAVRPAADARGVRLETMLDPRASPISGDSERLQQVFWNLLSNAVKFTNRDGRVAVHLDRVDSHVEIVVTDTGVGIPPAFLPHIFERFRQADASTTRERGGLGLGLAIARQLTEMHGGTIDVSSEGVGRGASFRVTLPLMVDRRPDAPSPHAPPTSAPAPHRIQLPDLSGVVVLAVDDERDALALVEEILEAAGARVVATPSAADALAALDAGPVPDVILADLAMPQMDGFELIARVRHHSRPGVRAVPAAAVTAYARSEDRVKALRSGFQVHLSKPVDPAELMTTIAALARRLKV